MSNLWGQALHATGKNQVTLVPYLWRAPLRTVNQEEPVKAAPSGAAPMSQSSQKLARRSSHSADHTNHTTHLGGAIDLQNGEQDRERRSPAALMRSIPRF